MSLTNRRVFCIITGASRGIGREIVLQLSKILSNDSAFLITARSFPALNNLKEELLQISSEFDIRPVACDFSKWNTETEGHFKAVVSSVFSGVGRLDAVILVHNAATVGAVHKRAAEITDEKTWSTYLRLNVTAAFLFNNAVLSCIPFDDVPLCFVVNISSLLAVKGVPSFSQYSAAKAAREGFFRVLAVEEPYLRVLNYCPGPVSTDMLREVHQMSFSEDVRKNAQMGPKGDGASESQTNRRTLTAEETVKTMMQILQENTFESGSRIDFFDFNAN